MIPVQGKKWKLLKVKTKQEIIHNSTQGQMYTTTRAKNCQKEKAKEMKRKTWKYLTKEMIEEMEIPGKRKLRLSNS